MRRQPRPSHKDAKARSDPWNIRPVRGSGGIQESLARGAAVAEGKL